VGSRTASVLGKLFRRLADFLDSRVSSNPAYRGTRLEVEILTLGLVFIGLVTAGIYLHGWRFLVWDGSFAIAFCTGSWLIFRSSNWSPRGRGFLLSLVLVFSVAAAADRIVALVMFILLSLMVMQGFLFSSGIALLRRETLSVVAVGLLCFSSYEVFSTAIGKIRNVFLFVPSVIPVLCNKPLPAAWNEKLTAIWKDMWQDVDDNKTCRAGEVVFSVPEFWILGKGSALIHDISSIINLKVYADSATDNSIAFSAFSAPAGQVMQQLSLFLVSQKGFLSSRLPADEAGKEPGPLIPTQIMKGKDTQLFSIRYETTQAPAYLAKRKEFNALILLHERRGVTWLFVVDGTDISAREFILHRIISGFR